MPIRPSVAPGYIHCNYFAATSLKIIHGSKNFPHEIKTTEPLVNPIWIYTEPTGKLYTIVARIGLQIPNKLY
jgi:hypothetical protein